MTLLDPTFWKWVCFFLWLIGTLVVIGVQAIRGGAISGDMDYNNPVHTTMRATLYVWLTMWMFVAMEG